MRANWWTAARPPMVTLSPTSHMAAERRDVGHGDVVADDAVMRDVRIGEEIAVVADRRLAAAGVGAGDAW